MKSLAFALFIATTQAQAAPPNILMIMTDDVGISNINLYSHGMMELDMQVGKLMKKLEELGVADNTIIAFTANNGPMVAWFSDAGTTPFRGEKATTWEGGVRVPMLIRWPERIKPGKISNGIQTNEDLFVTLAAAAGIKDVAAQLKESHKVHIDGVNNLDHWTGDAPSKRNVVLYYNESELTAIRIGNWKSHMKQRGGAPVNLDIDVKAFQIIPMFIWSPGIKFLGADVSSLVMPIYGKNSIAAELSTISQSYTIAEDAWGLPTKSTAIRMESISPLAIT